MDKYRALMETLKQSYFAKMQTRSYCARIERLNGDQIAFFSLGNTAFQTACHQFFYQLEMLLYSLEVNTVLSESKLQATREVQDIHAQLEKIATQPLVNLPKIRAVSQGVLERYAEGLKECGLTEQLTHFQNMNQFIMVVTNHLLEAKTVDVETAANLRLLKRNEFNALCDFIQTTLSETVGLHRPKPLIDFDKQKKPAPTP